ncbi:DNA repair protein RecN [Ruminococcaceae bacterium OttesenSCG-928-A16]|nr:DNA repair protein RecN [Ruminococcaceae bacterium OttesenSCG-928-A16]
MLCEITIENVAVIEKATAIFGEGFNVLTGETGAGKSILIDSINAILGNRTSRDIVRSGAAKASIWASFRNISPAIVAQLAAAGYSAEEELLLYREISADGKSNCRINGAPATAAILRDICSGLINIHGQHDNQSLLNPAKHLGVLDTFAQNEALLAQYSEKYTELQQIEKQLGSLQMDEAEKNRRLDLLRYEVDEIEKAELTPDEEEALTQQRDVIRHAQTIVSAMNNAYIALTGGDDDTGAATLLGEASGQITEAARYATDLAEYANALSETYYTVTEIASDIGARLSHYEFEGDSLDTLEERLDLIFKLKQKYGATVEEVINYGQKAAEELESIEFAEETMAQLQNQQQVVQKHAIELAQKLTDVRISAFEKLNGLIQKALDFLNMPGIVLALQHKTGTLGPKGQDILEFYISTNPGETPKPLAKIASGGELARIMLALKSALADRDEVDTVIYDEIDTGISGLAAGRIGRLLQSTAKGRQVICVTHTAQVAAYASQHLLIEKQVEGGRTFTHIRALQEPEKVGELARIISGDHVTDLARANAEEMLRIARKNQV